MEAVSIILALVAIIAILIFGVSVILLFFKKYRPRGHDSNGHEIFELVPLNQDWPTITVNADNPGQIVGTVMEHRRRRRRVR